MYRFQREILASFCLASTYLGGSLLEHKKHRSLIKKSFCSPRLQRVLSKNDESEEMSRKPKNGDAICTRA